VQTARVCGHGFGRVGDGGDAGRGRSATIGARHPAAAPHDRAVRPAATIEPVTERTHRAPDMTIPGSGIDGLCPTRVAARLAPIG
jgi:hypothetical protein